MYLIVTENEKEVLELLKQNNIDVMHIDDERLKISNKIKVGNGSFKNISEFLLALGIKPHLKGFKYLKYVFENNIGADNIVKILYPTVAKHFNTTPSRVERAIRHCIKSSIMTPEIYELYVKLLGNFEEKPVNSQFIKGCQVYLENNPIG